MTRHATRTLARVLVAGVAAILTTGGCASARNGSSDGPDAVVERGEVVYGYVCERCHTFESPSAYGPAMNGLARMYLGNHPDRTTAAAAMVAWIREPRTGDALLSEHTVDRLMLMPGQPLSPADLEAVVAYVFERCENVATKARP